MKPLLLTPHRLPINQQQEIIRILHTIDKMLKQGNAAQKAECNKEAV